MVKKRQITDPHAGREAEKYTNPIPSREYILQILTDHGQLLTFQELEALLHLTSEESSAALGFRLKAMLRDGQIICTRKRAFGLPQKMSLHQGVVMGHPDGFGFVKADADVEKKFLPPRQMRQVMHGDVVMVRGTGNKVRGLEECIIVEVLQRNTEEIVGRFHSQNGAHFVIPESKYIQHQIIVPTGECCEAEDGDIVMVRLVAQPDKHQAPVGKVTEVVGQHMDPGMEIDIAIRVHGIPVEWPDEVTAALDAIPTKVSEAETAARTDLRDVPFVTIDGEDAKDFDDAVYCETTSKGWTLYVAIADVAHYITPDSALDKEALNRGNSVYFPGRVVPMLPFKLSAGICSLKPEVDRLALVCKMELSKTGKINHYEFLDATICSKARLTYTKVAKMLQEDDVFLRKRYNNVVPHLESLYDLFQVLHKNREKRGALDLDLPETKIVFSNDKKIQAIERVERNDAHRLIEECMLVANVCAAKYIIEHEIPGLFRVHPRPNDESLAKFREFLDSVSLSLGGGDEPTPKDYARILKIISDREDRTMIQTVLLRSLSQAVYQAENMGHFGLAYEAYAHYTSPIRRYPDLLIHRAIKHILKTNQAASFCHTKAAIDKFGAQCSVTERRADDATRDVVDWLKCEYMQDKVGETFVGKVGTVTAFGLFVTLQDVYVEGLVHVTSLPNDYYRFDAIHHQLIGERAGSVFKIGDELTVRVTRVDLDERKIDFDLGDDVVSRPETKRKRRKKRHG